MSLIVGALAAGAAAGSQRTASQAVEDAYSSLRALVLRRFAGRPRAEAALAGHDEAPERFDAALRGELVDVEAGDDAEMVRAAERLTALLGPGQVSASRYLVQAPRSQGVQTGEGNIQTNTFGVAPPSSST